MHSRGGDWTRLGLAALLWVLACVPFVFWWMDEQTPGSAVDVARSIAASAWTFFWITLGLGLTALVLYPPSVPGARIWFQDLKRRMSVDRGPMIQAISRMQHHETSDDHHLVAQTLLQTGDPARAFPHAVRAVEIDSESLKARFLLGRILQRVRNHADAARAYESVVGVDPGYAFGDAMLRLGECLAKSKQDELARTVLEQHERNHGSERRAMLLRAKLAARRGDAAERSRLLREAARPPIDGEHMPLESALARAHARVALWRSFRGREIEETS